jgi:hypothetical protein
MQKVIVLNQSLALTKRWSGRLCDLKSAAHLRTDSSVRKSSSNMSTSAPLELSRMYVAASCALSALRHARNTFIPSRAKDRAVSLYTWPTHRQYLIITNGAECSFIVRSMILQFLQDFSTLCTRKTALMRILNISLDSLLGTSIQMLNVT